MTARVTRQVRIKKKHSDGSTDNDTWVDVEILAGDITLGWMGKEFGRAFGNGSDGAPWSTDLTPDGDLGTEGNPGSTSNATYFERIVGTSGDAATQMLDVEVLQAFSMFGDYPEIGQEHTIGLDCTATGNCYDKGGIGGGGGNTGVGGRNTHTVQIIETTTTQEDSDGVNCNCVNTDDDEAAAGKAIGDASTPGSGTGQSIGIVKVDVLNYLGTEGFEHNIAMTYDKGFTRDATQWTVDGQGNKAPPDWTPEEGNRYVSFPAASAGPWVGNQPDHSFTSGSNDVGVGPINQGPLWWIKRASQSGRPWYWYTKTIQELEFSGFGSLHLLLPNFASVIILAIDKRPFPGLPIPLQGFDSLDGEPPGADQSGQNGDNFSRDNLGGNTVGSIGGDSGGATALNNMQGGYWGGYFSCDVQDFLDQDTPGHAGGLIGIDLWGHWGLLGSAGGVSADSGNTSLGSPMTDQKNNNVRHVGIESGAYWKIWENTGVSRPPLQDPHKPYDRTKNPYVPSPAAAREAALTFGKMWNDAADAMNELVLHAPILSGGGGPVSTAPFSPPSWDFNQPFVDAFTGLFNAWSFNGPINASIQHVPAVVCTWPMSPSIGVAQLDPKKWDTTLFPPVLRSFNWAASPFRSKPSELIWIEFLSALQSGGGGGGG